MERMSDELSEVLAELARGLGTNTGELWTWLQGDGLAAYAKVQVARLAVETAFWSVVLVVAIIACVMLYRAASKAGDEAGDDDAVFMLMFFCVIAVVGVAVSFALLADAASELACWVASPEGMVIQKVLEMTGR